MSLFSIFSLRLLFVFGIYAFVIWSISVIQRELHFNTNVGVTSSLSQSGNSEPKLLLIHPTALDKHPVFKSRTILLEDGIRVTFGRSSTATVPLYDTYVSKIHCRIEQYKGQWNLYDEGSTNSTLLNGQILTGPAKLRAQDVIRIGKTIVEVR